MTSISSNASGATRRTWPWNPERRPRCGAALLLAAGLLAAAAPAAGQQFGRNKVQYRSFDFEVLRTEHFDVHFYPVERTAAMDAARMSERAYARLSRLLRHEFRERKPIILYASHAHFQQTNALSGLIDEATGGATEIFKNRVILPFTGSYADFDHVLTHELVHAFQFDVIFRTGIVMETGRTAGRLPLWFMEGMAEYLALGGIDAHTASWVRDAALRGYIRGIREMNRIDDYLSYRFGQSLWAYVGERWGDEVIGVLLQKAPRLGVEAAFVSTLGVSLDALSRDWLAAVRSDHLPAMASRAGPESLGRRLTRHESLADPWYLAPALSPDGTRLVFASQRDGFSMDLWLSDAETGRVLDRLVEGAGSAGFESLRFMSSAASFSPDGRWVAFVAQTGGADALYLYDVEGRRVARKLEFELEGITNPTWSPDGRRLAFSGMRGGWSDLYVTDLEGRLERLTRDAYADLQPAWSPDGRTLAFTTDRGPDARLASLRYGNMRVALLQLETRAISVLPHQDEGKNINPAWSPDGQRLAWVSDRSGVNNLFLFDLRTAELARVSDLLSGIIGINHLTPVLSWAASGRLVFVHFESGGYNLYAVEDPATLPVIERFAAPATVAAATEALDEPGGPRDPVGGAPGREDEPTADGPAPGPFQAGEPIPAPDPAPALAPASAAPRISAAAPAPPADSGFQESLYREADAFRPSGRLPVTPGAASGPLSVRELLDSADLALPDTASFTVDDYRMKLTADVIGRPTLGVQAGGLYGDGVYGGSFVSLSDMLGNHNVVAAGNLNGSLADATIYGGYAWYGRRPNLIFSLQQVPLYRYRGLQRFDVDVDGEPREALANVYLRDVIRSAELTLAYPFSPFRRLELGVRGAYFQRDYLFRGYLTETEQLLDREERLGDMSYVEPTAALVFDNALFGWTGPIRGRRYRLQVSHTEGGVRFTEGMLDLRNYWNHDRWLVLATRLVALARVGPDSDRFSLFWGGPYFIRGYNGGSFRTTGAECVRSVEAVEGGSASLCPVRDQLIGSSGAFLNVEARFPVITRLRLGPLGRFPPVDGVLFFDGGLAWDERICTTREFDPTTECAGQVEDVHVVWDRKPGQDPFLWREPLYSWGVGLRLNIFYAVLRLDYAFPLSRDRGGVFSLAFGPSF